MAALNSRDLFIQGIYPRLLSQTYSPLDLDISLQGTNIVVKLVHPGSEADIPKYIASYRVKLWRQGETSGTYASDWWTNGWDSGNMLEVTTLGMASFNLLDLPNSPTKRISADGINYQIACKAVDSMGTISTKTLLGSIKIKTISI